MVAGVFSVKRVGLAGLQRFSTWSDNVRSALGCVGMARNKKINDNTEYFHGSVSGSRVELRVVRDSSKFVDYYTYKSQETYS